MGGRLLSGRGGLRGDGSVGLQRCLRWCSSGCRGILHGYGCSHGGDASACTCSSSTTCATTTAGPSASGHHAYEDGHGAHDADIGRADADELVGDARLRHEAGEDGHGAHDEGTADMGDDSCDHGADVHVGDARGGHEVDEDLGNPTTTVPPCAVMLVMVAAGIPHGWLKPFHCLANGLFARIVWPAAPPVELVA